MNELSPRSKTLLQLARHADVPEAEARRRVARSLGARLAASASVAALGTAVSKTAMGKTATGASLTLFAAKTVGLAGTGAVLTFAAVQFLTPAPLLPPLSTANTVTSSVQTRAHAVLSTTALGTAEQGMTELHAGDDVTGGAGDAAAKQLLQAQHSAASAVRRAPDAAQPDVMVAPVQPEPAVAGVAGRSGPSRLLRTEPGQALPYAPTGANGAFELGGVAVSETPREPSADSAGTLLAEGDALREAQQALRAGEGRKALRLLQLQDQRFGSGVLQQERAAARVLALCQAGEAERARGEAARFEQSWPRSPLLARVRGACREDRTPAEP